jgi:4-oxalocrotonate tautomerase
MPVIRVEMLGGRSRDQKRELAAVFTHEMARIAKCDPQQIQVVFADIERRDWATGGVLVDEEQRGIADQSK